MSGELIVTLRNGCRWIKFNRPKTKNAFNRHFYETIASTLNADANNDDIVVTILTGCGEYYSSGFDIKSAMKDTEQGIDLNISLKQMINAFINYPKILIALINGPAIGIAVTTAALCDVVYASDRATFQTPFVNIGLCAEGGSSYTFPRILGRSKATEMLLLGEKMSAEEAYKFGFVARVVPHGEFEQFGKGLEKYAKLPLNSVKVTKRLINAHYRQVLCECNEREMEGLRECFGSEDFMAAVMKFMAKSKSKL